MKRIVVSVGLLTLMSLLLVSQLTAETHTLKLRDGRILKGEFVNASGGAVWFKVVGDVEATQFQIADILSVVFSTASIQPPKKKEALTVPIGTVVSVKFVEEISSRDQSAGQKFFCELAADVVVGETVVAKAGKRVTGRVRKVVKPKRSVDKAVLELVLVSVPVDGKDAHMITDFVGVVNDGKGNVNVTGAAQVSGATAEGLRDGKHVTMPVGLVVDFRLTQPMTIRP